MSPEEFVVKKTQDNYTVSYKNKILHTTESEHGAHIWITRYITMQSRTLALRTVSLDSIEFNPNSENKSNIILLPKSETVEGTKYIKIISRKNLPPELDIQNLDSNEVLGLMRRAEYMITNFVLRNGSI